MLIDYSWRPLRRGPGDTTGLATFRIGKLRRSVQLQSPDDYQALVDVLSEVRRVAREDATHRTKQGLLDTLQAIANGRRA